MASLSVNELHDDNDDSKFLVNILDKMIASSNQSNNLVDDFCPFDSLFFSDLAYSYPSHYSYGDPYDYYNLGLLLQTNGSNIDNMTSDDYIKQTMIEACIKLDIVKFRKVCEMIKDVNELVDGRFTYLQLACIGISTAFKNNSSYRSVQIEIVETLAEMGANIHRHLINNHNESRMILDLACCFGSIDLVVLFLKLGANPNEQNSQGISPFHRACMRPNANEYFYFFLAAGGDPNIEDQNGYNCLDYMNVLIENFQDIEGIKILLMAGVNIFTTTNEGDSILRHGNPKFLEFLNHMPFPLQTKCLFNIAIHDARKILSPSRSKRSNHFSINNLTNKRFQN